MGADEQLEPGVEVGGRYQIEKKIGQGGFSTVYRATQKPVGRPVALKVMKTQVGSSSSDDSDDSLAEQSALEYLIERFRREAKIIGKLRSPSTVTLFDFGRTKNDDIYMVLEYVDGIPLTRLRGQRLPPDRVVTILKQALESLGEAHEHGVLHRDIKPGNLMIWEHRDEPDRLKILDFGIAKILRSTDEHTLRQLTGESRLVGTPRYLAPELATNREPGPPVDIYSLGLVAHELLIGERAVPGDDAIDVLDNHLSADFEAHIPTRPAIPDELRRIVNRMTAKDLSERYATADEVLEALENLPDYDAGYAATAAMPRPSEAGLVPDDALEPMQTTEPVTPKEPTEDPADGDDDQQTKPAPSPDETTQPTQSSKPTAPAESPVADTSSEDDEPERTEPTLDVAHTASRGTIPPNTDPTEPADPRKSDDSDTNHTIVIAVTGATVLLVATFVILTFFVL